MFRSTYTHMAYLFNNNKDDQSTSSSGGHSLVLFPKKSKNLGILGAV